MDASESSVRDSMSGPLMRQLTAEASGVASEWRDAGKSIDGLSSLFLAYLRMHAQLGVVSIGPLTIFVSIVEELAAKDDWREPGDYKAFTDVLFDEQRASGRPLDGFHVLLALMKVRRGLPGRVFGELGVSPERMESWVKNGTAVRGEMERLYSPEEAASYLDVHIGTIRNWIRSGRLPASRLAGQRAVRVTESDLLGLLEPIRPEESGEKGNHQS